ncbi:SgcJ/EcaC family oxidoreductase [Umezawaea tangerina]|nr:SgcJ/EcaC family oxidoreductase [Umezawaea tangerina]
MPNTHPDETTAELAAIPARMIEAWNDGDATAFAAPFAEDAHFVAFEGTVLHGTEAVVAFHQPLFDTVLKGSRLVNGEVPFVRVHDDRFAVVHSRLSVILPGEAAPSPSRNSMELYTVVKGEAGWKVVAMQNSRVLGLDRQYLLDNVDALPADVAQHVSDLVGAIARAH